MDTKKCGKCHEVKPRDNENFPHNKRNPDGLDKYCKACWRLISQTKRSGTTAKPGAAAQSAARKAVVKRRKLRGWEEVAPVKMAIESAPAGVQVVAYNNIRELPKEVQFMMADGSLLESITQFREKYGQDPQLVYVPARYYIPIPPSTAVEGVDEPTGVVPVAKPKSRRRSGISAARQGDVT